MPGAWLLLSLKPGTASAIRSCSMNDRRGCRVHGGQDEQRLEQDGEMIPECLHAEADHMAEGFPPSPTASVGAAARLMMLWFAHILRGLHHEVGRNRKPMAVTADRGARACILAMTAAGLFIAK